MVGHGAGGTTMSNNVDFDQRETAKKEKKEKGERRKKKEKEKERR
jgi:hypothetical protein